MILKRILFYFSLAVFISGVASWTVSVDEMKIISSEEAEVENNKKSLYDSMNGDEEPDNVTDKLKYAEGYDYRGYKENKVSSVIRSGSLYLEGLSRALMEYRQTLEGCGVNTTALGNETNAEKQNCTETNENGKLVRKLSQLALQTATQLRDVNDVNKDGETEENELLLELAWFLDQLARVTGYRPNVNAFIATASSQAPEETTQAAKSGKDSSELLETVENGRAMSKLTAAKTVVKRSAPLAEVVRYYNKYKTWTGSNSNDSKSNYDVNNELKVKPISKRSLRNKKYVFFNPLKNRHLYKVMNISNVMKKPNVVKLVVVKRIKN